MNWMTLKQLVKQTGLPQARLVRAGKGDEEIEGLKVHMRGQGSSIEWAIEEAGKEDGPADEPSNADVPTDCLHCGAPPEKRMGKMCSICNREALREYKTAYKGPQYSEPEPPEAFEVEGGECEIRCPSCNAVFMTARPDEHEEITADGGGALCDCGAEFGTTWDGGAYVTALLAVPEPEAPKEKSAEKTDQAFTRKLGELALNEIDLAPFQHLANNRVVTRDRVHPMLPCCVLAAQTEPHSDAWHAARARGIGSSDAGAILGLSQFSTIQDAWATKVGVETDNKPWMEPYSDFGTFFEPHLRHAIRLDGVDLVDGEDIGTLQSLTWPRALANCDGLDEQTGDNWEIKTSSEEWSEVPPGYYAQCQHQMFVTGADRTMLHQYVIPFDRKHVPALVRHVTALALMDVEAENVVAAWLLEIGTRKTWIVDYDAEYVARMLQRQAEFWQYVENGEEPPVLESEGTVDLSDCSELVGYLDQFVIEQGRVPKEAIKAADKLKKSARTTIDEALALRGVKAKRIVAGPHKATWVHPAGRSGHWTIYGGDDDTINW